MEFPTWRGWRHHRLVPSIVSFSDVSPRTQFFPSSRPMLFLVYLWAIRDKPSIPHGFWLALVIFTSVTVFVATVEVALTWRELTPLQRRKKILRIIVVGVPYRRSDERE